MAILMVVVIVRMITEHKIMTVAMMMTELTIVIVMMTIS